MYNKIVLDGMEFLELEDKNKKILFSTALNNVSYKLKEENTQKNFEKLKKIFNLERVNYTNQIHSDIIIDLNDTQSEDKEADALILTRKNEAVGVFTADCVSVIIYDEKKDVVAAVHSGWKGTIADISKKTCEIMRGKYHCNNLKVVIGPSIGKCCYEVSEELATKFKEKYGEETVKDRMLDLKYAIKKQLECIVDKKNIEDLSICTNCNEEIELHSYRKLKEDAGRLFSFVIIK